MNSLRSEGRFAARYGTLSRFLALNDLCECVCVQCSRQGRQGGAVMGATPSLQSALQEHWRKHLENGQGRSHLLTPCLTRCLLCRQCTSRPHASKPLAASSWSRLSSGSRLSTGSLLMMVRAFKVGSVSSRTSSACRVRWQSRKKPETDSGSASHTVGQLPPAKEPRRG